MKTSVTALLEQQVQCVLATRGDQHPGLHLMAYAFSPELDKIYLASPNNTQKIRNIRAHKQVSLLWDNRTGNNNDHQQGIAISGFGSAREITGPGSKTIAGQLLKRNDSLKQLLENPAVVILIIDIDRYQWVEGYTKTVILTPANIALQQP